LENFEMKKTLVAVAALAAVFGAQAEATISGLIEAGILMPNTGASSMASGGNGGSEITFAAGEDLGNGLKASAAVTIVNNPFASSTSGNAASATALAATPLNAVRTYNSFIGLAGEFGSLKLGSQFSPAFFASNVGDPFGQAAGTYNLAVAGSHLYDSVNYQSPTIAGAAVAYTTTVDKATTSYNVTYGVGGFNAAYGSQTAADVTTTTLAANYDFGMAKLFAISKTETNQKSSAGLGVSAPVGPVVLVYSMSTKSGVTDSSNLGLMYPLSKRTSVALVNYNGTVTLAAGGTADVKGNFLGVRHTF